MMMDGGIPSPKNIAPKKKKKKKTPSDGGTDKGKGYITMGHGQGSENANFWGIDTPNPCR